MVSNGILKICNKEVFFEFWQKKCWDIKSPLAGGDVTSVSVVPCRTMAMCYYLEDVRKVLSTEEELRKVMDEEG
jgi:hypothetical protein